MPLPALPSATVLLIRDASALEVLMVRRHHEIEFAAGALVFPGGKVEPGDGDPAWEALCIAPDAMTPEERALRICAVREAFEESGILLARTANGAPFVPGDDLTAARAALARNESGFRSFVEGLGVRLDLGAMRLFAHWITPASMPKRFDTRFYLMPAPPEQVAACDGSETVDAEWIAPAEALRLREAGERTIVFPTRLNLALLSKAGSVSEALAATAARTVVPIEPDIEVRDGIRFVSIPPDAGYGETAPQPL